MTRLYHVNTGAYLGRQRRPQLALMPQKRTVLNVPRLASQNILNMCIECLTKRVISGRTEKQFQRAISSEVTDLRAQNQTIQILK